MYIQNPKIREGIKDLSEEAKYRLIILDKVTEDQLKNNTFQISTIVKED